jgi:hypothetical protein
MIVDSALYDFLKDNETGLYKNYKTNEIIGFVHISFYDLEKFVKEVAGESHFEEGGMEVQMFRESVCIDLNYIIEGLGHDLRDYKNCFNKSDWDYYNYNENEVHHD